MKRLSVMALACVVVCTSGGTALALPNPFTFGLDLDLIGSPGAGSDQFGPDAIFAGGYLHVVWEDYRTGMATPQIIYARVDQTGMAAYWPITSGTYGCYHPRVAASPDGIQIVVVTAGKLSATNFDHIYAFYSSDGGDSFDSGQRVDDGGDSFEVTSPDIAYVAQNTFVAVWESHGNPVNWEIAADVTSDGGANWQTDRDVSIGTWSDGNHNRNPAVTADAVGQIYVAHVVPNTTLDDRVVLSISQDLGASFMPEIQAVASMVPPGRQVWRPDVAAAGTGRMVVTWEETDALGYDGDVYANLTEDGCVSFKPNNRRLDHGLTGVEDSDARVALDERGGIYVVFTSLRSSNMSVYLAVSFDGLETASGDWVVSDAVHDSATYPVITADDLGSITVVFQGITGTESSIYADRGQPALADGFDDPAFPDWDTRFGVERSSAQAYDPGGFSARFSGAAARAPGLLEQVWPVLQQGIVGFVFWDGYGSDPAYLTTDWTASLTYDDGTNAGVVRTLGVVNPSSTTHYSAAGPGFKAVTNIPRSQGWHEVRFVVTDSGLSMYLDEDLHPADNPVLVDPTFTGFSDLTFVGGSLAAPYYLDEVVCTVGALEDSVPALSGAGLLATAGLLGLLLARRRRTHRQGMHQAD